MAREVTPQAPSPLPPVSAGVLAYAGANIRPRYAGFWQRVGAWAIDWAVLTAGRLVVIAVLGGVAAAIEAMGLETETVKLIGGLAVLLIVYLVGWAYYALLEASPWQATLGKRALGLRVEDLEAGRPSLIQTSLRFFLRLLSIALLGIGFLLPAFTRRRQALHDILSDCVVTVARGQEE